MHETELEKLNTKSAWGKPQEIRFRLTTISRQWATRPHLWAPPTDLFENERAYIVRVEIAGMQAAELNIAIEGRQLAIYGMRQQPSDQSAYYQMEVRFGEFMSSLELPGDVDTEKIRADYYDGFLQVTLPKARVA